MEDEKIIALYWDRDQTAIAETQQTLLREHRAQHCT